MSVPQPQEPATPIAPPEPATPAVPQEPIVPADPDAGPRDAAAERSAAAAARRDLGRQLLDPR